jgi:predicted O-linked N-acetylglucosamine transferase (SPINDLY family)
MTVDEAVDARDADELYRTGLALAGVQRWPEAVQQFAAAARANPHDVVYWLNLSHACLKTGDLGQGAQAAAQVVALDPRSELGLTLALECLGPEGRHGELVALFRKADLANVAQPRLHLELGISLTRLGRLPEAVQAFLEVLRRDPRAAEAFAQLGNVFQLLQMPEEARECFRNALALGRTPVEMASAVVFTSLEASNWNSINQDLDALLQLSGEGLGHPVPFYSLAFGFSRQLQLAASRAYAERTFRGIEPLAPRAPRIAGAPIRVGYVSSDFREHATAYLIAELFERHDRNRFEIFAYSYGDDDASPMRRRIEAAFGERFFEARQAATAELVERVRADRIDVLVDLKGFTLYARNELFAHRAAPIQVNFLGYPGTLGSPHYDYVIGDPIVSPLIHADGFTEKIAQMPGCYQPNDRKRPQALADDRARWQLPEKAFVLANFNANYKITAPVFDCWCGLLRDVDDAVLWLFETNPQARRNLMAQAQVRGVAPERIFWAGSLPLAEHLARIQAADLFLDTLPVNAHTTASDALWAGLPVLTVLGDSFVARAAASMVTAAGLPELVASNLEQYTGIARKFARDRSRLRDLRERLVAERMQCDLFDCARYTRDFEALITRMVERLDRGLTPEHLPVAGRAA